MPLKSINQSIETYNSPLIKKITIYETIELFKKKTTLY